MAYSSLFTQGKLKVAELNAQKELNSQLRAQKRQAEYEAEQQRKKEETNWFLRGLSTVGDLGLDLVLGAVKGVEGIYDAGATLVGAIGGLWDDDFQDDVKNHIANDWTGGTFLADWEEELSNLGYVDEMGWFGEILEGAASGVGQMLPIAALNLIPGFGQAASLAVLGISAGGNAVEEAYNDGAGYYQGLGYGIANAGIEVLTEKLFGGATEGLFGKGMLDDTIPGAAKTGVKRILSNAAEEGAEEMVAELFNPLTKSTYKGKDAFTEYGKSDYWAGVAQAGVIGATTALTYSGTVGYGMSKITVTDSNGNKRRLNYVGKEADINEALGNIETQKSKLQNLYDNSKLTKSAESKINNNVMQDYLAIEKTLTSMTESQRAQAIKEFSMENIFDAKTGKMTAELRDMLSNTTNAIDGQGTQNYLQEREQGVDGQTLNQSQKDAVNALISGQNNASRYYSPQFRGNESSIVEDLSKINNELQSRVGDGFSAVNVYDGELTKTGQQNYIALKKGLTALNRISGAGIGAVVVAENNYFNAVSTSDKFFINKESIENNTWARELVHEYTHFAEDTNEYNKLVKYLLGDAKLVAETQELITEKKNYFTKEELEQVEKAIEKSNAKNEEAWKDVSGIIKKYRSELGAHLAESVLGNENFINKLIDNDLSLTGKIVRRVKNIAAMFERLGNTEARAEYKRVKQAEKLYLNALKSMGYKYNDSTGKIVKIDDDEENAGKGLANSSEIKYNKKSYYSQYKTLALQWANSSKVKNGDVKILYNESTRTYNKLVADDSADEKFRVEKEVKDTPKNHDAILDLIKEVKNENNISKQANSESVSQSIVEYRDVGRLFSDDFNSSAKQSADGRNSQLHREKSKSGRDGDSQQGTGNSGIKFSLKEDIEQSVANRLGTTRNWNETGYILTNGARVDLSGRKDGAPGGYRTVDHRDVFDMDYYEDNSGTDLMIEFMSRGNIRLIPEYPGINIQVEPTDAQYEVLKTFIDEFATRQEFLFIDFDNSRGDTVDNLEYANKISSSKVISDIKYYFKEGKLPYQSDLSKFRYSLKKDSTGNKLTEQQAEFFKNSKIVDNDGNLLVVYHGTPNSKFNIFDAKKLSNSTRKSQLGQGFYFTDNKSAANDYTKIEDVINDSYRNSKNSTVYQVYLNIINPLRINDKIKQLDRNSLVDVVMNGDNQWFFDNWIPFELNNKEIAQSVYTQEEISKMPKKQKVDLWIKFHYDMQENFEADRSILSELVRPYEYDSQDLLLKNMQKYLDVDGIVFEDGRNINQYVAFNSNQIKETSNKNPTASDDIRFSLKDGEGDYNYSKGQIAKYVAEHSKLKAYSKTDAEQVVNSIVANQLSFGEKYGEISGKTKAQVIDILWHAFNTNNEGYRTGAALDIADYIIQNATVSDMWGDSEADAKRDLALERITVLKDYARSFDLSALRGEISYHYGNDRSVYARWGARKGTRGQGVDAAAMEIKERGIDIQSVNEADILFEIDDMYTQSLKDLKKEAKAKLTDEISSSNITMEDLRQNIAKEIMRSYDTTGHQTQFARIIEQYSNKVKGLKTKIKDIVGYNKAKNGLISTIEQMKEQFLKSHPAGYEIPKEVIRFVRDITSAETWRNNINDKNLRVLASQIPSKLNWIMDETQIKMYPYTELLQEIGQGDGYLTADEYKTLDVVFRQLRWQAKNYDKIYFENKSVSNTEIAVQGVKETKQAKDILQSNALVRSLNKFKNYVYANPYDRMAEMGLYQNDSVSVRMFNEMLAGDRKRAKFMYNVNETFKDFLDKNKQYFKDLHKSITIGTGASAITLTKGQALSLYATSLREQGRLHLFNISENSGVIHLLDDNLSVRGRLDEAFAKGRDVNISTSTIQEIKDSLSSTDKQYLELMEQFFKNASQAKVETDEALYGISNVENGYYFPLSVSKDKIFTQAGQNNQDNFQYVLSMGMNKSLTPKANNKIVIDSVDAVVAKHAKNMSLYYGYAIPLTAYNRITNKQVVEMEGADFSTNMRGEYAKIDAGYEKYMDNLWKDMQGIYRGSEKGLISNLLNYARWAGANAALGLNPKVLITQTTSLGAALAELDAKYVARGSTHFFGEKNKLELAKYAPLMWERMEIGHNIDVAEIRQMAKSKVAKTINNITTKPISWMDSNVIQSLWFGVQFEIADTKGAGYEFGTELNKEAAGKRLEEIVLKTQQTSDALGRSAWMRNDNEFIKLVRMFSGDAVQNAGRTTSAITQCIVAQRMIKSGNAALVEKGKALLKDAKQKLRKALTSLIITQAMLLSIAMAFKWIKGKDDDEEWSDVAIGELQANLLGMLPLGSDISNMISGYEPTNMAYSAITQIYKTVTTTAESIESLASNDYQNPTKRASAVRSLFLNVSKLLGIPTQNAETYIKGIIGHISPGTRAEYEALFKTYSNAKYISKIQQATKNGDEELAETYINIMFNNKTGKIKDDKVMDITRELIAAGYDVAPRSIGDNITYDGVEYTLTKSQHKAFSKIYSQSTEAVKKMVNMPTFNRLDEEAKAQALKFIYNYYYNLAVEDLVGADLESKATLFGAAVPLEYLAMAVSQASVYAADYDKNGKIVASSRKAKIQMFVQGLNITAAQKYMIMGYLGYTNTNGESLVKSYINSFKTLTKAQKQELFESSGYKLK